MSSDQDKHSSSERPTIPPDGPSSESPTVAPHSEQNSNKRATISPTEADTSSSEGEKSVLLGTKVRYFGDYELLDEIARGGMGVVYKARQISLNRIVALKMILSGQLASEEDIQRFRTEAQAAAGLQHPGIVAIHEVGEHEGQHYFSMDLVEGQSLAEVVGASTLAPERAAELVTQIADAIQYAHDRDTLHRDLKPSNILVDTSGQPRVTDFGLARKTQSDSGLTGTGQALGTPSYMPPEQAAGRRDQIGPASDVYSLGAILYELLTGRPPFRAESPLDTMLQVLENDPASPRLLNPAVPKDLETVALKCLEKAPGRRYPAAAELAADLSRFLSDEPIQARPIGMIEHLVRRSRKHLRTIQVASLAVAIVLAAIGATLVGGRLYQQSRLGQLHFSTDGSALNAEVHDESTDRVVQSFTVPNEEPISLAEGTYRIRMSASGQLSETSFVTVHRGREHLFHVDLTRRRLWPPMALGEQDHYELIDLEGQHDIILRERRFGEATIRRLHGATARQIWEFPLDSKTPPAGLDSDADDHELWSNLCNDWATAEASQLPVLLRPAPDLDGDGTGDLMWSWPSGAVSILVLSGASGKVLWGRTTPVQSRMTSAPLATDVNSDGRPDILATFWTDGGNTRAVAFSGKNGRPLWPDSNDNAFDSIRDGSTADRGPSLPKVESERFYGQTVQSSSTRARPAHSLHVVSCEGQELLAVQDLGHTIRSDNTGRLVLQSGDAAARRQLTCLQLANGEPAWPSFTIGPVSPGDRSVQFIDLDSDGTHEVLVLSAVEGYRNGRQLSALILKTGARLWRTSTDLFSRGFVPTANWPLASDLDGDGNIEIIIPFGSRESLDGIEWTLNLVDGVNGASKWPSPRARVLHGRGLTQKLLISPDANRDGHREVAVVSIGRRTHSGSPGRDTMEVGATHWADFNVYVDLLSGKDGETLTWWEKQLPVRELSAQDPPFDGADWWDPDQSQMPRLAVSTVDQAREIRAPRTVDVISLFTARNEQSLTDVDRIQWADFNGDGLRDLCYTRKTTEGSSLHVLAGAPPDAWQRLGGFKPVGDIDGDGYADLIETLPDDVSSRGWASRQSPPRQIPVHSGRDGTLLKRLSVAWPSWVERSSQRAVGFPSPRGDVNGDGSADVMVVARATHRAGDSTREAQQGFPLQALSGKTGARLWMADEIPVPQVARPAGHTSIAEGRAETSGGESIPHTFMELNLADLDRDGEPVLFATFPFTWTIDRSSKGQLQLAAFAASSGRLLWTSPLSDPLGGGAFSYSNERYHPTARVGSVQTDLDGDGNNDVVVSVPVRRHGNVPEAYWDCEVRALNGSNGKPLWPSVYELKMTPAYVGIGRELPAPVVGDLLPKPVAGDLNGDGQAEIVFTDYSVAGGAGGRPRRELIVLDGKDGKQTASWFWTGRDMGEASPQLFLADFRNDGRQSVCVAVDEEDQPAIVVLDLHGDKLDVRARFPATLSGRFLVDKMHPEGKDLLVYIRGAELHATRGSSHGHWRRMLPGPGYTVVGVQSTTNRSWLGLVSPATGDALGVDLRDGSLVWRGEGFAMDRAARQRYADIHIVQSNDAGGLPRLLTQITEPERFELAHSGKSGTRHRMLVSRFSLPAHQTGDHQRPSPSAEVQPPNRRDPRWTRPLPWSFPSLDWQTVVLVPLVGFTLFVCPGWLVSRVLRQRSRNRRYWRMIPVVAAAALISVWLLTSSLWIFGQISRVEMAWGVLVYAAIGTSALIFPGFLVGALLGRRWLSVILLIVTSVVTSLVIACIWLSSEGPTDPRYRYAFDGWYLVWIFGAYITGWLTLILLLLRGITRRLSVWGISRTR